MCRQVVLVLMYLRQNVSQTMLADLYGVSQPTVSRICRSIMPLLDQVLSLHEPELTSVFCNREVLVDGTLVPTGKHNWSSRRLRQGRRIQFAAVAHGTVRAVCTPLARVERRDCRCGSQPVPDASVELPDGNAGKGLNARVIAVVSDGRRA